MVRKVGREMRSCRDPWLRAAILGPAPILRTKPAAGLEVDNAKREQDDGDDQEGKHRQAGDADGRAGARTGGVVSWWKQHEFVLVLECRDLNEPMGSRVRSSLAG